jgi:hypothetical protein
VRKAPGPVIRRGSQAVIERWAEVLRGIGAEVRVEAFEPAGRSRKVEGAQGGGTEASGGDAPKPRRAVVEPARGEGAAERTGGARPMSAPPPLPLAALPKDEVRPEGGARKGADGGPNRAELEGAGCPEPARPLSRQADNARETEREGRPAGSGGNDERGRYWSKIEGIRVYSSLDGEAVDLERLDRFTTAEFFPALPERREPRRSSRRKWLKGRAGRARPPQAQPESAEAALARSRRWSRERVLLGVSLLLAASVLVAKLYVPAVELVHETARATYATRAPPGATSTRASAGALELSPGALPYRGLQTRYVADGRTQAFLFFASLSLTEEVARQRAGVELLQAVLDATGRYFSAVLERAQPLVHDGQPGLEAGFTSWRFQREYEGRVRAYLFGEDVLVLLCEGNPGMCTADRQTAAFFSSFAVRPR